MEVSFVSLLSLIQLGWLDEEDTPPTNNDMCNVEDPPYPTPQQSSAVESWSDMCNMQDTPYATPHQSSAVQSWNDICNVEDPPYPTPH